MKVLQFDEELVIVGLFPCIDLVKVSFFISY